MKLTRKQRRELRANKLHARETELNIVSLIDVFAVLVFFLLVNSSIVAARLNIISMNLPGKSEAAPEPPKEEPLNLTIVIRPAQLEIKSRDSSYTLPNTASGHDLETLGRRLAAIKLKNPKEQNVTLALEPDIPYEHLVHVMDAARLVPPEGKAQGLSGEMFPNIALADAKLGGAAKP